MSLYTFVVLTNAEDGREDEYNDWYNNQHLADVLNVPGFVSAKRFALADAQRASNPSPYKYLALYDIETDDLAATLALLGSRSGTQVMPVSDAMANEKFNYVFEPILNE